MIYIQNARIINEGSSFIGGVIIEDEIIAKVFNYEYGRPDPHKIRDCTVIDAEGMYLAPGIIDDQVHFREPGATWKGDIESESRAAIFGGITSYMDMPNNNPPVTDIETLENKYRIAAEKSFANYSFYLGADNDNIREILKIDKREVCGVKVFMGSSTGNMLVDNPKTLEEIFRQSPVLIATHCEDEAIIKKNLITAKEKYGESIPFSMHPEIRSREACIASTQKALNLAIKHGTRLHILHISTAEEVEMIMEAKRINPNISAETCVHYMWFDSSQYNYLGAKLKCNPAIKNKSDRDAIIEGVRSGAIDVVATDHAPHLLSEKDNLYLNSPSGLPLVQHSLLMMLELHHKGIFSITEVIDKMCHSPAKQYGIDKRGYIREGYYADLILFRTGDHAKYEISKDNIAYKCEWSPLEGAVFHSQINHTFVNGKHIVAEGKLTGTRSPKRLTFKR